MTESHPSARSGPKYKAFSRSLSQRVLPTQLRPKTAPTSPDPGEHPAGATLAPPLPLSPRIRRSSAPEEGTQTPHWRSNQFTTPLDSDIEFVRRTYAHFSVAGVPDDGFSDGKEYTREKNGLPAWEEAALSRPNSTIAPRNAAQQSQPLTPSLQPPHLNASAPNGVSSRILPVLNVSRSTPSGLSQRSVQSPFQSSNAHLGSPSIPASFSAQSSLSNGVSLSTDERRRRQELAEKRRGELIGNIDRYGFFSEGSTTSHHKAVLLPSTLFIALLPKKSTKGLAAQHVPHPTSLADTTPHKAKGSDQSKSHALLAARSAADVTHRQREQERIAKWARMLTVKARDQGHNAVQFDFAKGIDKKLRRRIFKGIPDSWRSAAWAALIQHRQGTEEGHHSYSLAKSHMQTAGANIPISLTQPDAQNFDRLKAMPCPHDVQIDLDVPRTISGHIQFHTRYGQGQRALFHVLHAISMLCEQCGYCQGMGPIAATLLCYFTPERAYAAMVLMHNHVNLHSTFAPGFPGLVENLFVQDQLLRNYMPELADVFDQHMVVASSYATKWYITLFSNSIPFETQLRVWDAWLLDGQDVITLVAVALIWAHRGVILEQKADFESILSALSSFFVPEDDDALMFWVQDALARRHVRDTIGRAREEYRRKVERGDAAALML
ncbi:related to GYP5 - GTPase-activating protein for Ypt Proteins [Melanopsichium pennsylvanicum]|uniref:Related to GYP5 - GTPase-activating protein for Ypt Proteins n=2 Tax=Melanopsichium pennsylvanicum TaxID=63383 RepID=A0AAJ4XQW1_9BASI|nr:tbc [Melanopsichium pennsylvanicum 4]SNX86232.1 related to GYP5 - GTPase-activating protein for Ypt Proteins [Melanopsichium pennsylvanicum]